MSSQCCIAIPQPKSNGTPLDDKLINQLKCKQCNIILVSTFSPLLSGTCATCSKCNVVTRIGETIDEQISEMQKRISEMNERISEMNERLEKMFNEQNQGFKPANRIPFMSSQCPDNQKTFMSVQWPDNVQRVSAKVPRWVQSNSAGPFA